MSFSRPARFALFALLLGSCALPAADDIDPTLEQLRWPPADRDSDGDTIADLVEGWPARDSDGDGTPDYLDLDADGNGIPDEVEGAEDRDLDGVPDFADLDDDDDELPDVIELGDDPENPRDTDGDGTPDFRDRDSDGDTILDRTERGGILFRDTDGDGIVDYRDLDSDGDGWTDAEEAGDTQLVTPPVDTDLDGVPDYLDLDSDGDGLQDAAERELGTDRASRDGDGDGVSDILEIGAGTDPNDSADNPRARGDFTFVVPFREAAQPTEDIFRFTTHVTRLDAYFLVDRTGSMAPVVSTLRSRLAAVLDELQCEASERACNGDVACEEGEVCGLGGVCIEDPALDGCVADVQAGVGSYGDGAGSFRHHRSITDDFVQVRDSVPVWTAEDGEEALFDAARCLADASACPAASCADAADGLGCPAFREDALRVVVIVTDSPDRCPASGEGACRGEAADLLPALAADRIRVLGVDVDVARSPRADLTALASRDANGDAFYAEASDGALVADLVAGLTAVAAGTPLDLLVDFADQPDDEGDAGQFVQRFEVDATTAGCDEVVLPDPPLGDPFVDELLDVTPGTPVCWRFLLRPNARVREIEVPQVFQGEVTLLGDGVPLDRAGATFIVPLTQPRCAPDDTRPECR